jgi:hypothetical protein
VLTEISGGREGRVFVLDACSRIEKEQKLKWRKAQNRKEVLRDDGSCDIT